MCDISFGFYFIFTDFFKIETEFFYLKACEECGGVIVLAGKVARIYSQMYQVSFKIILFESGEIF